MVGRHPSGVVVREVVNCGGIAEKNPFVMQIYADVCNRPMKVSRSAQTCALGAALFGAVVGGAYESVEQAQRRMTGVKEKVYHPDKAAAKTYGELYRPYCLLHDAFGTSNCGEQLHSVMKDLLAVRQRVRREA
jgi:L-ribulokinase